MSSICAHRGGALLWPENSLTAFRHALALPIEEVECDVHLSADGVAMVHHDATLDRTTEGTGPVAHRTAAELAATPLRGLNEGLPSLAALLELVAASGKLLRLEIKANHENHHVPALLAAVRADLARIPARIRLMSFLPACLAEAAMAAGAQGPDVGRALARARVQAISQAV
jgi:glycerophosphoryl diester phosphodiesterase